MLLTTHGVALAQARLPSLDAPTSFAPFAKANCLACHNSKEAEGGFDLEDLLKSKNVSANPAAWHAALERIVSRDMPPKKAEIRPTENEYRTAEDWIRGQLHTHEAIAAASQPRSIRRLNRDEYNRTIQEIFGLPDFRPADDFPPDDKVDGFTNVGEGLHLSAVLIDQYLSAGQRIAQLALSDAAKPETKTRTFSLDSKDWATVFRGHDPGGAVHKGKWVGDHLFVPFSGSAGVYRARMTADAQRFDARPGYIPNFQYRVNSRLVFQADAPIRDGKTLNQEFTFTHLADGDVNFDFRWVNGFPDNNNLRARDRLWPDELRDKFDGQLSAGIGHYLLNFYGEELKKNPDLPYPWPYFVKARLEIEGPLFPHGWPRSRFQRENAEAIARKDAKSVAAWLLPKLFRRPARNEELLEFATFVESAEAEVKSLPADKQFLEALRLAVQRALVSPHFLFLVEPGPVGRKLTDHELAVRLSYFLWSAPPDEELTRVANEGKLRPALAAQAKRMLADPKSRAFVDRFTREWLDLDRLTSIMPEPELYPRFDNQGILRQEMAGEPLAIMRALLAENGSLYDLLDADYTYMNDRLADHYHLPSLWPANPKNKEGLAPVSGGDFRKVKLPDGRRGGLVTTAAFLAMTSENTRTSPVKRGVWVLEKLFNRTPPPPPPNVNGVLPDTTGGTTASEKLKLHRNAANCAGCHARIDPFGLALENYDVIGEWRDREWPHIDPSNPLTNRAAVRAKLGLKDQYDPLPSFAIDVSFRMGDFEGQGPADLKKYLRANKGKFARGFSEKLLTYALGRRHVITDEPELTRIRAIAEKDDFRFRTLVLALIENPTFQSH